MKAFIIFRDRVTYARRCLTSMLAAGLEPVVVDHGSTWPEAVAWLKHLEKQDGIDVVYSGDGQHPRSLWGNVWFRRLCSTDRYIVTDPDVVPSEDCPADWVHRLWDVMERYPGYHKAGLGLRIDRIPAHYARRENVLNWEAQFWNQPVAADGIFHADIDTTLAMYCPVPRQSAHSFLAMRTGPPYVADHLAWYEDLDHLTDEQAWYHEHAEQGISHWTVPGRGAADPV